MSKVLKKKLISSGGPPQKQIKQGKKENADNQKVEASSKVVRQKPNSGVPSSGKRVKQEAETKENGTAKKMKMTTKMEVKTKSEVMSDTFRLSPEYREQDHKSKFEANWINLIPFKHWHFKNFIDNSTNSVKSLEEELQNFSEWRRKENDLYSLYQSDDLKAIDKSKYPKIYAAREFLYKDVKRWLEAASGVKLTEEIDCNASCYAQGDHLLPHNDQIGTRKFAFVYYLTEFGWKEEYGGYLQLYESDKKTRPTSIAKSLPPLRNSFVLFEVNQRTWHRVQEVLGDSPRLSINGWFHSTTQLSVVQLQPNKLSLGPALKNKMNLREFLDNSVLDSLRHREIAASFENRSELLLNNVLKHSFYTLLRQKIKRQNFVPTGKPNESNLHICECLKATSTSVMKLLMSKEFETLVEQMTGLELKESPRRVQLIRVSPGSYSLLTDGVMKQNVQLGNKLRVHLFIMENDIEWQDEWGGFLSYTSKGDVEELVRISPVSNSLALVFSEPDVAWFLKFANTQANTYFLFTLTYTQLDNSEDE